MSYLSHSHFVSYDYLLMFRYSPVTVPPKYVHRIPVFLPVDQGQTSVSLPP